MFGRYLTVDVRSSPQADPRQDRAFLLPSLTPHGISLSVDNSLVRSVPTAKNLGVALDNQLSFKAHISLIHTAAILAKLPITSVVVVPHEVMGWQTAQ